jgi:hypothetical protein
VVRVWEGRAVPRLLLALLLVVLALPAAAARGEIIEAGDSRVSAAVAFEQGADEVSWRDLTLTVRREGAPVVERALKVRGCEEPYCRPVGVVVRDLDADGEPEVLVDVFTGGAHCCTVTELLTWDGAVYRSRFRDWLDAGYTIRDLNGDGRPELQSVDARFRYEFASFAGSAFPVQVWQVDGGAFADVTAGFPALVRRDAARWLRIYRGRRGKRGREWQGALAAWAADQERLGGRRRVDREMRLALRRKWIDRAYLKALDRFLVATGYRR